MQADRNNITPHREFPSRLKDGSGINQAIVFAQEPIPDDNRAPIMRQMH